MFVVVPQRLDTEAMTKARVEAYESSNPSKIAVVRFPADVLQSEYGTILYVALLLSQKVCIFFSHELFLFLIMNILHK